MDLSSKFYTIVPHNFGRQVPKTIDNAELLQKKFDMLTVRLLGFHENKIEQILTMAAHCFAPSVYRYMLFLSGSYFINALVYTCC